jgi:putative transposase
MGLALPENLERVLSSTNLIENLFSRVRAIGRRGHTLAERHHGAALGAAGVLEAERGFRKLAGYRVKPSPVAALRTRDTHFTRIRQGVDASEKAA